MSEEKDMFNKLIEEKIKDFEVPYEASHWAEMSQKLDAAGPIAGPTVSSTTKKILWSGAAAIALLAGWYFLSKEEKIAFDGAEVAILKDEVKSEKEATTDVVDGESSTDQKNTGNPPVVNKEVKSESSSKTADSKMEKYASYSEQNLKEESKHIIDQMVDDQKASFGEEIKIDNAALKTEIRVESAGGKALCEGVEVQFDIDREIDGASYYWNFGDNALTSRKSHPNHTFRKAGTYIVTLLVSKGEIGSKNDFKAQKTIVVEAAPRIEINSIDKSISLNDPYAEFDVTSGENCQFSWTFNSNTHASGRKAAFLIPDQGSYSVHLTALANNGCASEKSTTYAASKGVHIEVEDAFSPNGDGRNEDFIPKELTIADVDFTFTVTDKTGQVVFQTKDKYQPWNGEFNNNGSELPAGLYFWKLSFTDDKGAKHEQKGKINLLR